MHPLFRLIATRPQLLAEHAEAYAALVAVEAPRISAAWKRSAIFGAAALFSLVLALTLAGVALMLWAVLPEAQMRAPWALIAVPLAPLALAVACWIGAKVGTERAGFENLRQQVRADMQMLREVSTAAAAS